MKRAAFLLCLMAFTASCFAQEQPVKPPKTAEQLQALSVKQKKTANALLIAGSISAATGPLLLYITDKEALLPLGSVLFVGGLSAMVVSIPFYISASKNKQKAREMNITAGWQGIDVPMVQSIRIKGYPALGVRLRL